MGAKKKGVSQACFLMEQTVMLETAFFFPNYCTFEEHFYQNYEIRMCPKEGSQTSEGFPEHCST